MEILRKTFIASFLLALLSGCSYWEGLNRTEKGAIIGGGTGALVGSQIGDNSAAGAIVGGAAGAAGGGLIDNQMDKKDKEKYDDRYRGRPYGDYYDYEDYRRYDRRY